MGIGYSKFVMRGLGSKSAFDRTMSATTTQTSQADLLQARFIDFGAKITGLVQKLPRSPAGTHYARQMLRSGTAAAPNYAEARSAESRADFIHKMRIVLKELNETAVWLRMALRSGLLSSDLTSEIHTEAEELCRIVAASIRTAKSSQRQD
jgi:four helix bundle protein